MPVRARPRAFTVLLASEFVSLVGDRLAMVALIALVYAETRSPAVVALLMLVRAIPAVALGGLAGSVVDRFDRRAVMVTANVVQGFVVLSIPALGNVTLVIAAYAVMSIVNQFFIPARSATIPDLVDSDGLGRANAAFGAAFVGALAVGPVIGGLIADRYGLAAAFYADSVTFFVPAIAVGLLRFPARTSQAAAQRSSLVGDTMAALRHAAAVPEVYRALAAQAGAALVIAVLSVIGVVVASDSLGLSTGGYGAMMSAMGVGMLLGALVLGRRSAPEAGSRSYAAPLGLVVAGADAALLAWLTSPAMAMVASAGVGAGVLAVQIRSQTVLQSSAADLRARLISLGQSVSGLAQIVATVLTAGVAALAGAPWVLTGTGFVAAALGVFLLVDALPTLRMNRNPT
jgi:dTMP kinase